MSPQRLLCLAPVPWYFARIYRRRGMQVPEATSGDHLAALVPYRFRGFHERYANALGFFWLPCVLCGKPHGGHEIADVVSTGRPNKYVGICPACTTALHTTGPQRAAIRRTLATCNGTENR